MEKQEQKKPVIKFGRNDGISFPASDFSDSIVRDYVHKQVVVKTGEGEDDWVLDEKPVMVREHDINKEIQEEAKKNNLKALITQVLRTGDESLLIQRPTAQFGDVSNLPEDLIEAKQRADAAAKIMGNLPESLKGKTADELLSMSNEDILKAYGIDIPKAEEKPEIKPEEKPEIKSEEKGSN